HAPRDSARTLARSTSKPSNRNPLPWKTSAKASPTEPWPMTPTTADRAAIRSVQACMRYWERAHTVRHRPGCVSHAPIRASLEADASEGERVVGLASVAEEKPRRLARHVQAAVAGVDARTVLE